MPRRDPRFDAYIHNAAPFAQPILSHLRELAHQACPDVEETMKWQVPHFEYKGPLFGMAGFKRHAGLFFWKGRLLERQGLFPTGVSAKQLHRMTSASDLPNDRTLLRLIAAVVAFNEQNIKVERRTKPKKAPVRTPADFMSALKRDPKALAEYRAFPPSHKREYVEWIQAAKQKPTRERRIVTAVQTIARGRSRHWKYQRA